MAFITVIQAYCNAIFVQHTARLTVCVCVLLCIGVCVCVCVNVCLCFLAFWGTSCAREALLSVVLMFLSAYVVILHAPRSFELRAAV